MFRTKKTSSIILVEKEVDDGCEEMKRRIENLRTSAGRAEKVAMKT